MWNFILVLLYLVHAECPSHEFWGSDRVHYLSWWIKSGGEKSDGMENEPCSSLRPSLKSHPVEFPGCPSIVMDRFEWKEMDSNSPTSSIVPYQHRLNRGVIGCYRCAVCTHHARLIGILVSRMYLGQQRARATDITALLCLCSVPLRQFHLTAIATDNSYCSALLRSGSSTSPR